MKTSGMYWFKKSLIYPQSVLEIAARYDKIFLWGHTDLRTQDYSCIDHMVTKLRAINPTLWIGMYVGGLAFKKEIDPPSLWLNDVDLYHRPDGTPCAIYDDSGVWSGGDVFTYCLPNISSQAVVDKIVNGYVQLLQDHHLNGILLDGYDSDFYATLVRGYQTNDTGMFSCPNGVLEGPMHLSASWDGPLANLGDRLKLALESIGCEFHFNGIHPGFNNVGRLPHASGAMMEKAGEAYGDPTLFAGILDTVKQASDMGKRVMMSMTPYPNPATQDIHRFYLGTYLLCDKPGITFSYTPWVPFRGWDGTNAQAIGNPAIPWESEWDLDFGTPLTDAQYAHPITVAWRSYSKCIVIVNPNQTYQQFPLGGRYRLWHPTSGTLIDMTNAGPGYIMNVPPNTGWVLFYA